MMRERAEDWAMHEEEIDRGELEAARHCEAEDREKIPSGFMDWSMTDRSIHPSIHPPRTTSLLAVPDSRHEVYTRNMDG